MAIRAWISRALPRRGEFSCRSSGAPVDATAADLGNPNSFGWVNASYVYGLQIVNAHMRRALGTLTPHETFVKAVEENKAKELAQLF